MKIRPVKAVKAEVFHVDRRTDRHDEGRNHFSQFCESTKNGLNSLSQPELKNRSNRFEKFKCYIQQTSFLAQGSRRYWISHLIRTITENLAGSQGTTDVKSSS